MCSKYLGKFDVARLRSVRGRFAAVLLYLCCSIMNLSNEKSYSLWLSRFTTFGVGIPDDCDDKISVSKASALGIFYLLRPARR